MSTVIDAVYQGGVFRPTVAPQLAEGTAVRLTVVPSVSAAPDGRRAYELLRTIAELPDESPGDSTVTGRDHDRILYGGPGGVL